jgi:hypothetical protein
MTALAAAQASGDFTWPDVGVVALGVILILGIVYLVLRD